MHATLDPPDSGACARLDLLTSCGGWPWLPTCCLLATSDSKKKKKKKRRRRRKKGGFLLPCWWLMTLPQLLTSLLPPPPQPPPPPPPPPLPPPVYSLPIKKKKNPLPLQPWGSGLTMRRIYVRVLVLVGAYYRPDYLQWMFDYCCSGWELGVGNSFPVCIGLGWSWCTCAILTILPSTVSACSHCILFCLLCWICQRALSKSVEVLVGSPYARMRLQPLLGQHYPVLDER